jgi:hypothetical protein
MKGLYRLPLDLLEEVTTGMADRIFVNSGFTKEVCSIQHRGSYLANVK